MVDIIPDVLKWYKEGFTHIAIAVLIDLEGSAVRGRGAAMAVREDGLITGSVSGGCIESAVLNTSKRVFSSGKPEIISFCQIDDEILGSISPCGGEVTIAVLPLDTTFFLAFSRMVETGRGGRWGLVRSGPEKTVGTMFALDSSGQLLNESFNNMQALPEHDALSLAHEAFHNSKTCTFTMNAFRIFSAVLNPVPQLIIIGASHIGIVLKSIAELTGYMVTVIDPRGAFTREERFETKERIFKAWPRKVFREIALTPHTAVAAVTHDAKIDDQALEGALKSRCFYIGALGSTATHHDRVKRLRENGFSAADCKKIHSPIGLPIQSANPEEIALSIMAEVVREYRNAYGKDG